MSLKRALTAFNGFDDEGRLSSTVRDLQHAFEMLLKAGLVQKRVQVFEKRMGRSHSFKKCLNLAQQHLGLSEEDVGMLRVIDALRDEAQHWYTDMSEGLLYAHVRSAVTVFDQTLAHCFGERLSDHLPHRVMPISAEPPRDIQLLIDEQFSHIADLLRPGRRRTAEARAKIRALLAMEAHTAEDVLVSEKDVSRVQRAIRSSTPRAQVFPQLSEIESEVAGDGLELSVRFVKKGGLPVRYIAADDPTDAAAVREVPLQKKYHFSATQLAEKLGLTPPKSFALRQYLEIDDDPGCTHVFDFGGARITRYSDNALQKMRISLAEVDIEQVWESHRPGRR